MLARQLDGIRKMEPNLILSGHLPPARRHLTERMLSSLARVPTAQPFVGPDQAALVNMMAQMSVGAPA